MLILIKCFLGMLISFIISLLVGYIIVPKLKKLNINQTLSVYLEERHKDKIGTPTLGGLIFIISTIFTLIIMILFKKIEVTYNLLIIVITFIGYALIGFLDDYLIIKRHNNKGLTEKEKLFLQVVVATIFFVLFLLEGNEPLIWIHTLNIKFNVGFLYGFFIMFILIASSNAVNITDGLDGLAGGLSFIALISYGVLANYTSWLRGNQTIGIFLFILAGGVLGFLFFNAHPAKIFMGDTGSLALGATLGATAIVTRHELLLILVGIVFVVETLTCIIQRIYYKKTRKRLFKMTPIHHAFEKSGWKEEEIVRLFFIVAIIASLIAISFGVFLWKKDY